MKRGVTRHIDSGIPDSSQSELVVLDEESPIERMKKLGVGALTDAELLSVVLSQGNSGLSRIKELLLGIGGLPELLSQDIGTFRSIAGIGEKNAMKLSALVEIIRRSKPKPHDSRKIIRQPADVVEYYAARHRGAMQETFHVLLLNSANQVFREVQVSLGSLNASIVHPREVFRSAIAECAASVVLVHNHPSGNPEPSREDIAVTRQLREAGAIIDIKVLDHVIIAGESFTSFSERGLM